MSARTGFDMHRQPHWLDKAKDVDYPAWVRVGFAAWGRHRQNWHAEFKPGELRRLLGIGQANLSHAIQRAVDKGLVGKGSNARCLRVLPSDVEGGTYGRPADPCQTCANAEKNKRSKEK